MLDLPNALPVAMEDQDEEAEVRMDDDARPPDGAVAPFGSNESGDDDD